MLDPPVIERILTYIGGPTIPPTIPPAVMAARSPPQAEINFDQTAGTGDWPEMDQRPGAGDDTWG